MRAVTLLFVAALLFLASCGKGAPAAGGTPDHAAPTRQAEPLAEGATCKDHGVLEAICTRCNPRLIPVFQAKGDWCAEHGLPESVCPICHPERGGRPARDVSAKAGEKGRDGDAPADGTKVRFKTKEVARLAGIQTARAEERKEGGGVVATARLAYDATRVAYVNARSPGVVRAIHADVGAKVKRGDPLAVVESAEVGADRSRLVGARARVEVAQKDVERHEALGREGLSSAKDLLDARRELAAAKAELAALGSALAVVGGGGSGGSYTLGAPLAGVITQRTATAGKRVGVEELLFEVVDVSAMWAELDVPEMDLASVAPEQRVVLRLDGLGDRRLEGAISYLAPAIDPHTRTARARVPLDNPDGRLRANMYGQARILAASRLAVMVPEAAVQRARTVHLVFVKRADDEYEARRVEIGIREGGLVEIIQGIRPGDEVATQGSFLLKTETLKETIGAGCCDVD